jgi:hypothetical protein
MKNLVVFALIFCAHALPAQKYFSKTGKISFYSDAALEKIEAHNSSASTVIDAATGSIEWAVLIQGFKFDKSLMQDHFNENYMESSTYPKAKFKGKIDNLAAISFSKDGTYNATISGTLEMHGVTKAITVPATFTVKNGMVTGKSKFSVLLADFKIEVPKLVADNVSEKVTIDVSADYQLMNTVP